MVAARARVRRQHQLEPRRERRDNPERWMRSDPTRAADAERREPMPRTRRLRRETARRRGTRDRPGADHLLPPPTSAAMALWCGVSNGGARLSRSTGSPQSERMQRSSAASSVRPGRMPGRRPATSSCRRRRTRHQQVVAAGRRDDQRLHRLGLADDVGELEGASTPSARRRGSGSRRSGDVGAVQSRDSASETAPSTPTVDQSEPRPRWRSARSHAAPARAAASTAGSIPGTGRSRPSSPSSPMCTVRRGRGIEIPCRREGGDGDRDVEPRAVLGQARRREVDRDLRAGSGHPAFCRGVVHPLHAPHRAPCRAAR